MIFAVFHYLLVELLCILLFHHTFLVHSIKHLPPEWVRKY